MTPIFLISLPRAGSTLLQRILMSHPLIASKSEPWLMLPLVYMLKPDGMVAEYNHRDAYRATRDFIEALPGKDADYLKALNEFASSLFARQCTNGEVYFLDKTPRYYLIVKELAEIFPEARFIFLVRNPIQVIASIITSFSNSTLRNLHFYHVDFYKGFDKLAEGMKLLANRSVTVRYESLVTDPVSTLNAIFQYLDLEWQPSMLATLDDRGLSGNLGDKWGTYAYSGIQSASLDKWRETLNSPVRKHHIRRIIERIDAASLHMHGYEKELLIEELAHLKTKMTLTSVFDLQHIVSSTLIKNLYLNLFRRKVKSWSRDVIIS